MLAKPLTGSTTKFFLINSFNNICLLLLPELFYSDQRMCVSWNSKKCDEFPVSNGVRQGGVLSPIFVYIDDLLLELERQGIGCYWNKHFVGAVCYADDITLLAPSPSAL